MDIRKHRNVTNIHPNPIKSTAHIHTINGRATPPRSPRTAGPAHPFASSAPVLLPATPAISKAAGSPERAPGSPSREADSPEPARESRRRTRAAEKKAANKAHTHPATEPDSSTAATSALTRETRKTRARKSQPANAATTAQAAPSARSTPDEMIQDPEGQDPGALTFDPKSRTLINDWLYMVSTSC